MKILFSNPPGWESDGENMRQWIRAGSRWPFTRNAAHHVNQFAFGAYLPFPFFLCHSAGYTQKLIPDATIEVRDSIARGEGYIPYYKYCARGNFDWIVIETGSASLEHDRIVISTLSNTCNSKVILCGPIDDSKLNEILDSHSNIHAVVKGEYDKQIHRAVNGPRGIYEHNLLTPEELLNCPFPIWDEECADHYWDGCPDGQIAPQLQLWTSRGCPFRCSFCVWPAAMTGNDPDGNQPRSVRFHSPEYVEAYIEERLTKTDYKSVYIDDDTFNLNGKHVLKICEVMKRIGLPWSAMCRADTITKDVWQAMRDSGCFGVKLGFESGSQYVIDHIINKRLDLKEASETARWLRSIGMTVHGTFTIGLPGETKLQMQETIDFIQNLYATRGLDTHQLSGTAVIDGTPLSEISKGRHLDKYDGSHLDSSFVAIGDGQKKIEQMTK